MRLFGEEFWSWLASVALVGLSGCGHSEGEYRARVREVADLQALVAKAEAKEGTSRRASEDAFGKIARMERELAAAGIDPEAIGAGAEQQARALELWRRRTAQADAAAKRLVLLREGLAPLVKDGVAVVVRDGRIVIRLPGDALFDTGREALRREGKELLAQVARVIRGDPVLASRAYQVVGHVDAGRYAGPFKDGWGLSAMRAREVLAALLSAADRGGAGLRSSRWSAAGQGDADPLVGDDSAVARAKNRRCEIVELPAPEELLDPSALVPPPGAGK